MTTLFTLSTTVSGIPFTGRNAPVSIPVGDAHLIPAGGWRFSEEELRREAEVLGEILPNGEEFPSLFTEGQLILWTPPSPKEGEELMDWRRIHVLHQFAGALGHGWSSCPIPRANISMTQLAHLTSMYTPVGPCGQGYTLPDEGGWSITSGRSRYSFHIKTLLDDHIVLEGRVNRPAGTVFTVRLTWTPGEVTVAVGRDHKIPAHQRHRDCLFDLFTSMRRIAWSLFGTGEDWVLPSDHDFGEILPEVYTHPAIAGRNIPFTVTMEEEARIGRVLLLMEEGESFDSAWRRTDPEHLWAVQDRLERRRMRGKRPEKLK